VPEALAAHLSGGATTVCRCWRLERTDGTVMGFTDHDRDIAFEGVTFAARTGLSSTGDVTKAGLSVGGLEVMGALSSAGLGAADLETGLYDFARVTLWLVNWADPSERLVLREGTLGEVVKEDGAFRAEVRGPMQALETVRGRVITVACDADLGDGRCKVDLAPLTEAAVVTAVGGTEVTVSGLSQAAGWYSDGFLVVTSGAEAGARRAIVRHGTEGGAARLTLRSPLVQLFAGDSIDVVPGCDKRIETCAKKFANQLNFQGFPHLPGNDRAFTYARGGA
jgi:uncharacterized phage protein (TIGR02218 family)